MKRIILVLALGVLIFSNGSAQKFRSTALSTLGKSTDPFTGITTYKGYSKPIAPYIIVDESSQDIQLRVRFICERMAVWIRFNEILLLDNDGNIFDVSFDESDYSLENYSDSEWVDIAVDCNLIEYLRSYCNGKLCRIRFSGDQYHHDYKIRKSKLRKIKRVIDAYDELYSSLHAE